MQQKDDDSFAHTYAAIFGTTAIFRVTETGYIFGHTDHGVSSSRGGRPPRESGLKFSRPQRQVIARPFYGVALAD